MNAHEASPAVSPDLLALLSNPETLAALTALSAAMAGGPAANSVRVVPTVSEFHPRVVATYKYKKGTRETYATYWNRFVATFGDRRLDELPFSTLAEFAQDVMNSAVKRRNANGGLGAHENCVGALRAFFRVAVDDKWLTSNPAADVAKEKRTESERRALTAREFAALDACTRSGGDDPLLDTLLLRFHAETGARRGGAIALRLNDLDPVRQCVRLHEKNNKSRWQPVSLTLFTALLEHAEARGATMPTEQVFHYRPRKDQEKGAPLTRRRYNTLADRWQKNLPWAAMYGVSPHWLRHTALTAAERISGSHGVARRFAGHGNPSDATSSYTKATMGDVAMVLSAMTGEPHPLCEEEE